MDYLSQVEHSACLHSNLATDPKVALRTILYRAVKRLCDTLATCSVDIWAFEEGDDFGSDLNSQVSGVAFLGLTAATRSCRGRLP